MRQFLHVEMKDVDSLEIEVRCSQNVLFIMIGTILKDNAEALGMSLAEIIKKSVETIPANDRAK